MRSQAICHCSPGQPFNLRGINGRQLPPLQLPHPCLDA